MIATGSVTDKSNNQAAGIYAGTRVRESGRTPKPSVSEHMSEFDELSTSRWSAGSSRRSATVGWDVTHVVSGFRLRARVEGHRARWTTVALAEVVSRAAPIDYEELFGRGRSCAREPRPQSLAIDCLPRRSTREMRRVLRILSNGFTSSTTNQLPGPLRRSPSCPGQEFRVRSVAATIAYGASSRTAHKASC